MSTSPNGLPNGQSPNVPPQPIIKKKRVRGDPLVARKRPQPKSSAPRPVPNAPGAGAGARPPTQGPGRLQTASAAFSAAPQQSAIDAKAKRAANGGWLDPAPPGARDYKIVTTKRALKENMRYHVLRFSSTKYEQEKKGIDPTNQDEFTRPVTLQRRDPRQPPPGREVREELPEPNPVDEQEAERLAQLKAEREAQKAIEQAKSAPSLKDPTTTTQKQKQKQEKKDNVKFYRQHRTEEQKKQSELRYEEALPWHLEDADGKNVWVGSYVAPLSDSTICFVVNGSNFQAIPLGKWYKFTAKPPFNTMRLEDAEKLMDRKVDPGRWFLRDQQKKSEKDEMEATRSYVNGPARVKTESSTFRRAARGEKMDHDQIDMEGEEFQDDDEAPNIELDNDEDTRDSVARVRRNMLGANLFGDADEKRIEQEEEEEKREEEEREKLGKKTKKSLIKREKETIYQSDSDNPSYFSSTESEDDSDAEQNKEGKDDENASQKQDAIDKGAAASTSKGATTPSGKQKQADALKKGKSLKRPGSPNLSESSGNESTRKKLKKQPNASVQASRSSTPLPQGQAGQKTKLSMGSTSDGEATAGEMSDGQPRKKKIKLLGTGGAKGTPVGSRAGSPMPGTNTGSGAVSPVKEGSPAVRAGSPSGPVEAWEIIQALPPLPNGITIGNLMKHFVGRVGENPGQMGKKDWIKLVKENCAYGPDKILRRKA